MISDEAASALEASLHKVSTSQIHPYMFEGESDLKYESGPRKLHMATP